VFIWELDVLSTELQALLGSAYFIPLRFWFIGTSLADFSSGLAALLGCANLSLGGKGARGIGT
jgi:hypothetical protein